MNAFGESWMPDVIGIALLLALAFLFKLFLHSTVAVHVTVRVIRFSLISYWVLLALSAIWFALAILTLLVRVHR